MIHGTDDDPDVLRDSIRNDDMPPRLWSHGLVPALPVRPLRSDADAERDRMALMRRAERLIGALMELDGSEPPTLPDADESTIDAFTAAIEDRVARAAGARGHRYARRAPGRPWSCPGCARPIDRAAEYCLPPTGA